MVGQLWNLRVYGVTFGFCTYTLINYSIKLINFFFNNNSDRGCALFLYFYIQSQWFEFIKLNIGVFDKSFYSKYKSIQKVSLELSNSSIMQRNLHVLRQVLLLKSLYSV
jgi:hypothetical protein